MADRRLSRDVIETVQAAWQQLVLKQEEPSESGRARFRDNEADTGMLKDVDALNTLIEPFLLAPSAFEDPPVPPEKLDRLIRAVLNERMEELQGGQKEAPKKADKNSPARPYRGFSAAPYTYVQLDADFVDCAASFLRLLRNYIQLLHTLRIEPGEEFSATAGQTAREATDVLLDSAVEDRSGVRWQAIYRETDPPGRFANLFFTNCAALNLHYSLQTPELRSWLGREREEKIEALLSLVPKWTMNQYDSSAKVFLMDPGKNLGPTVSAAYALEILYVLCDPLQDQIRDCCRNALQTVATRMTSTAEASNLQVDFFHTVPFPSGSRSFSYDDRRYLGYFLYIFSLAKSVDPDVVTDAFVHAGDVLLRGVAKEWVDEPTRLWDDGRPLICYTFDALLGLLRYSLEGVVGVVTLRENDLRTAVREALTSTEVVDAVFESLLRTADLREGKSLENRLKHLR